MSFCSHAALVSFPLLANPIYMPGSSLMQRAEHDCVCATLRRSSMLLLPHFGLVAADCAALAVGVYCNQSITNINFSGNNIGEDASVGSQLRPKPEPEPEST